MCITTITRCPNVRQVVDWLRQWPHGPLPQPSKLLLWAEALESGRYKQGNGHLYLDGRHCCLGVLTEIADTPAEACEQAYLDDAVAAWLGLPGHQVSDPCIPMVRRMVQGAGLAEEVVVRVPFWELNDQLHWTFKEIAAAIRVYAEAIEALERD